MEMMEGKRKRQEDDQANNGDLCALLAHNPIAACLMALLPIISQMAMFRAIPGLRARLPGWNLHARFTAALKGIFERMFRGAISPESMVQLATDSTPLSGSAVLSALLGAPFLPRDVDYFSRITSRHRVSPSHDLLQSAADSSWQVMVEPPGDYQGIAESKIAYIYDLRQWPCDHDFHVQTIIIVNEPETYIRDCFDLDFLRNLYTSNRLLVMKPEAVLHQASRVNTIRYPCLPIAAHRYARYTERDFSIEPWFPEHDVIAMHDMLRWTMEPGDEDYAYALKVWRKQIHEPIVQACQQQRK
jgi:hypothetical protein